MLNHLKSMFRIVSIRVNPVARLAVENAAAVRKTHPHVLNTVKPTSARTDRAWAVLDLPRRIVRLGHDLVGIRVFHRIRDTDSQCDHHHDQIGISTFCLPFYYWD